MRTQRTGLARVSAIRVIVFDRAISSIEQPLSTGILHVNVTRPLYATVFVTIVVVIAFTWRSRDPSYTRINAIRIARRIVPMEFFLRNCLARRQLGTSSDRCWFKREKRVIFENFSLQFQTSNKIVSIPTFVQFLVEIVRKRFLTVQKTKKQRPIFFFF